MILRSRWGRARQRSMIAAVGATSALAALLALQGAGCQQAATPVPTRSLERSGRVSFVCLGSPDDERNPKLRAPIEHALEDCTTQQFSDIDEFTTPLTLTGGAAGAGGGSGQGLPHLYALVTQTTRGEVAVIDTSSLSRTVLDQNPIEPGANLLPVGALPTSIVSTPGSVATFVGVGEIGHAGIFALPSSRIRPASTAASNAGGAGGAGGGGGAGGAFDPGITRLSTWPACGLPAAPGDMLLVEDPPDGGDERVSCDDLPSPVPGSALISVLEKRGRQKLVVAIPDLGGIAVIDAQALLDRPAGSFDPCPVDRWLPLEVDLTGFSGLPLPPPPPEGAVCVNPALQAPALSPPYTPRPGGLAYADGTLYVADLAAPVIHVIDMPTPCEPFELAPLLPVSRENPKRVVTTGRVSIAPAPTPDLKQYLYATDVEDGSLMVFDVGPASTSRVPLSRPNAAYNPFAPPDRVRFSAPAADILVVQNDVPEIDPATGLTVAGVRCDPNPSLLQCVDGLTTCDIATSYRTNPPDYTLGAAPNKLRGTFALAALTDGHLAVIDLDDLDARCRGPVAPSIAAGCATEDPNAGLVTSQEASCSIVLPGAPRSQFYEVDNPSTGAHVPGVLGYPLLHDVNGGLIALSADSPQMKAPTETGSTLHVAGADEPITGQQHELLMNLEDPRAHILDQEWSVRFEGVIPAFGGNLSDLRVPLVKAPAQADPIGLYDPNARFCDFGVLGEIALQEMHQATLPAYNDRDWARLADYVQITSELPDELDPYWSKLAERHEANAPNDLKCAALEYEVDPNDPKKKNVVGEHAMAHADCLSIFGNTDTPLVGRDLRIVEAYQDHVVLQKRPELSKDEATGELVSDPLSDADKADLKDLTQIKCCFPGAVSFQVRTGQQWLATGSLSGYLHHVVADPETGRCRNSCDPLAERKNSRVIEASELAPGSDGFIFVNPMFRFAIERSGTTRSITANDRDKAFTFITTGAFRPLLATLRPDSDTSSLIQPQALTFVGPTGEVAVTDGSINGLIFVSLASMSYARSFF